MPAESLVAASIAKPQQDGPKQTRVIAFIFARGGSKGLPGKNIKLLGGKPLIGHSIETARACPEIETVIVSTDDDTIASISRDFGAETPFVRPTELASDKAAEWHAWQHAIEWFRTHRGDFDVFLSLPTTAPLRAPVDVRNCLQTLLADEQTELVITATKAARNPYFNMVKMDDAGFVSVVNAGLPVDNRQASPQFYDMTTVAYAARPNFVMRASRLFDGRAKLVEIPPQRAIDIDTLLDFEIAEFLYHREQQRKSHGEHQSTY